MRAVEPVPNERLAAVGLALSDLVLVVRKNIVDASGVHVEGLAEILPAHRGAFDVPAWPSRAERAVPEGLAVLSSLPESEVLRRFLLVLVRVDPRAVAKLAPLDPREPA